MAGDSPPTPTKKVTFVDPSNLTNNIDDSERISEKKDAVDHIDLEQGSNVLTGPEEPATVPSSLSSRIFLGNKSHPVRAQRKVNSDTGTVQDKECVVQVVEGLLDPMNPMERRRKEFLLSNERSKPSSSQMLRDQFQYRLRSKTVRLDCRSLY